MDTLARSAYSVVGAAVLAVLAIGPTIAVGQVPDAPAADTDTVEKGAPYVPTPEHIVRQMLSLADVTSNDVVYDLGSGDGRILILAAKEYGARGVGVEIDEKLVERARRKAERAGVSHLVEFRQGDLFQTNLEDASVVTLYLWPDMNNRLRPKLRRELDPGDRVVSHSFDIDGWEADSTLRLDSSTMRGPSKTIFRWVIPDSSRAK